MDLDFGVNAGFVEELYAQYLENPDNVEPSWRTFFEQAQHGAPAAQPTEPMQQWERVPPTTPEASRPIQAARPVQRPPAPPDDGEEHKDLQVAFARTMSEHPPPVDSVRDIRVLSEAAFQARVAQLINAYRVRGHLFAHLDPLGLPPHTARELDLQNFGLRSKDLDKPFSTADLAGVPPVLPLREIIGRLEETYCRSIGAEFTFIEDPEPRQWLQQQMESTKNRLTLDPDKQVRILTKLSDAEIFEQFIHRTYQAGTKRFSLEGAESLIPLMDLLLERAGTRGVDEIVVGMAHRGRLNVLANVLEKSLREIFACFEDTDAMANLGGGDVKYHLGYSVDRRLPNGATVHVTLTFNPSHLEFVNPVVQGRVRGKQDRLLSHVRDARRRVMPLLIHGDAAFMGEGIVAETLNMMDLKGYTSGGTVHVIVNNQIGFTTNPNESRSTRYASDITRMMKVPVFHVNGEDPEAVAHVAQLAIDYRQRFCKDVVIDMYCYRRYGHNEGDEPRYTQPKMYAAIDKKPTIRQVYVKRLVEMGQITEELAEQIVVRRREKLAEAHEEVKQHGFEPVVYSMGGIWASYRGGADGACAEVSTSFPEGKLIELSQRMLELPEGFQPNPKIIQLLKTRHERLASGEPFDWGTGEMLAYASLLSEKTPVRLSGQDSQRGTFSHRHAVLFDMRTGESFAPLSRVCERPARFDVYNSPLSEAGVLGFDFGYSLDYPDALVVWEAQFGDFLNAAQVIVDQFITSSEDKWHRLSGLVLYLPHGYEGQGPEHSSARLERFLQNSAEDNIQVCNLTTPAQLFHALRRQVLRLWRKPLVIATPKSMLRVAVTGTGPHRPVSTLRDLSEGRFHRVIGDTSNLDPQDARRILLCTGKIYYDLARAREERKAERVAILRLEQLYPLNEELVNTLAPYKDGTQLVWVQEEPKNYGLWYYINAILPEVLDHRFPLSCVARAPSASPATGSAASHVLEQGMLMDSAFGGVTHE